jgi:hypothetical protein
MTEGNKRSDLFEGDNWKTIPLITRDVRLDADGMPWTGHSDPVRRERIREVYLRLFDWGETGRQIVAVHQEIIADLQALARGKEKD